jgi:hypothetical protein
MVGYSIVGNTTQAIPLSQDDRRHSSALNDVTMPSNMSQSERSDAMSSSANTIVFVWTFQEPVL